MVNTELVNVIDWLPLAIYFNGSRFNLGKGTVEGYHRSLDLRNGLLTRTVRWQSPSGDRATLVFQRFASLADRHTLFLRCEVTPEFAGTLEFRASLNGHMDNLGVTHCNWIDQGLQDGTAFLHDRTRQSEIDVAMAMSVDLSQGHALERQYWDAEGMPAIVVKAQAEPGKRVILEKRVSVFTSREVRADQVESSAVNHLHAAPSWAAALEQNSAKWDEEWNRSDIVIEGDPVAQRAVRFNLFELLIAAPREDDDVSIGAKTLSGFGYRGHVFWDTETFMFPFFVLTAPEVARRLLDYRYARLEAARAKARAGAFEGAEFAWESADTGEEVTPSWLPDFTNRSRLIRIWTGEIEIHISADIAYAIDQYWQATGNDAWFIARGAEMILDTAKFWASRAEWIPEANRYEYKDVIGPDEYHEHVNNNAYTNELARWNLQTALRVLDWLRSNAPAKADELVSKLDLSPERLARWADVIDKIYVPMEPSGVIPQFDGFSKLQYVDLASLEPRVHSVQHLLGIEGANRSQVIKQPDVLMLLFLLRDHEPAEVVRTNYDYYTPRTDHTYGSSLGPGIQAVMACEVGRIDEAYVHFWRGARADLYDIRGNAGDGIHGASAGGTWQAVLFGFAGLRLSAEGWKLNPRLPHDWKRLAFKFYYRGKLVEVDLRPETGAPRMPAPALVTEEHGT